MKKPLFFCTGFVVLVAAIFIFTGSMGMTSPPRPLYRLEGTDKNVLITFNTLWETGAELDDVLLFLESHKLETIFFVTGDWVKRFPLDAAKILQYGQYLGNHTLSYCRLTLLTEEGIQAEIKGCNDVCAELLDYTPLFFRPPQGEYNGRVVRVAEEADCLTLLWSINAQTITEKEPAFVIGHLEEHLHPGAIILFHLTPDVPRLLPALIDFLTWKGYDVDSPQQLLK